MSARLRMLTLRRHSYTVAPVTLVSEIRQGLSGYARFTRATRQWLELDASLGRWSHSLERGFAFNVSSQEALEGQ